VLKRLKQRKYQVGIAIAVIAIAMLFWKPEVLIWGVQRAGMYAVIALPMALILGVVGIINLAHGDFMMIGSYLAYWLATSAGMDPLIAIVPAVLAFFIIGIITYLSTIKFVIGAPELNQLLLTFGLALILEELANLLWTSQTRNLHIGYVSNSVTVGNLTFGTFDFIYVLAAIFAFLVLYFFLKRTTLGKAATAVGQNPRGARLVGINVNRTYLIIFSISIAIIGGVGAIFAMDHSIFPFAGAPYTLKSFCLIAMAGIGNLQGILWYSLLLGVSENLIMSFPGFGGWADMVFFVLIIAAIMIRTYRQRIR
jgi:branched-chain amino acid transport system permease protein